MTRLFESYGRMRPLLPALARGIVLAGAVVFFGLATTALAQDAIEASAAEFGYDCQLVNEPGRIRTVYIRHTFTHATASRFRVALDAGMTMTYLSETHPMPMTVGDTQTGMSVCYGECQFGPVLLATISYMTYGTGPICGQVLIVPHPGAETVEVLKCDGSPAAAWIRDLHVVDPDWACGCPDVHRFPGSPEAFDCTPLSVAQTTWGAVKALYRN